MQLGVCINLVQDFQDGVLESKLAAVAAAGYHYVETVAAAFSGCSTAVPGQLSATLKSHGLRCSHANVLFPATMRLTGDEVDPGHIAAYLRQVLPQVAAVGARTVVLGSGGARRVPDGFSHKRAWEQFGACARMAADLATQNGMCLALEHLNPGETNLLTTVGECLSMLKAIGHPHCGLLFDYYHTGPDPEELAQVAAAGDRLYHVHLAMPGTRRYPVAADREELAPFLGLLRRLDYRGTISLEATPQKGQSFVEGIVGAFPLMAQLEAPSLQ